MKKNNYFDLIDSERITAKQLAYDYYLAHYYKTDSARKRATIALENQYRKADKRLMPRFKRFEKIRDWHDLFRFKTHENNRARFAGNQLPYPELAHVSG